ncbi:MAG: hypothetical protein JW894_16550 [Bacteroidales bacterium]|nr:hypothetical protein [Bacteroidales bacterium]
MNIILGIAFLIHAVFHLIGFLVPWQVASMEEMPYRTTLFNGRIDIGFIGIRIIGMLWLLTSFCFFLAAIAAFLSLLCCFPAIFGICAFSILLSVAGWPDTVEGTISNIILIALLILTKYFI